MGKFIESYSECSCGAITLYFADGATDSVLRKNLSKFGISLRGVKKLKMGYSGKSYCCNHCVNHYGIDICSCGSGESPDSCSCGSGTAMETFGQEYDGFSRILQNFAR